MDQSALVDLEIAGALEVQEGAFGHLHYAARLSVVRWAGVVRVAQPSVVSSDLPAVSSLVDLAGLDLLATSHR